MAGSLLFMAVRGGPTTTARPTTHQKFNMNKQAAGGAYIPASLKITGPQQHMAFVHARATSSNLTRV